METDDQHDALFKALGHRARRQMLDLLKDGPLTTGALCNALSKSDRYSVMQHLKVLEKAGLVVVERRGRERWNHLDALPIHNIQQHWIGPYAAYAATKKAQLRHALDNEVASATTARGEDDPAKP